MDEQAGTATELDERDREMLDFEREWWKYAGAKEQAIRTRFDLSTSRYYELLQRRHAATPAPRGRSGA